MNTLATLLAGYRVAAAELAGSVRATDGPAEIVAVHGDPSGLAEAAQRISAGARVVIVDRPRTDDGLVEGLLGCARAGAAVLLARPGLRADVAGDAAPSSASADVAVQVQAPARQLLDALVDAVGWARLFGGGVLALRAVARVGGAVLADLAGPGAAASVLASERLGGAGEGRLRVTAVGVDRVEVVSAGDHAVVTRSTRQGDLTLPRRWESVERLALRRAIAFLSGDQHVADLDEWAHDVDVAARISAAHHAG